METRNRRSIKFYTLCRMCSFSIDTLAPFPDACLNNLGGVRYVLDPPETDILTSRYS